MSSSEKLALEAVPGLEVYFVHDCVFRSDFLHTTKVLRVYSIREQFLLQDNLVRTIAVVEHPFDAYLPICVGSIDLARQLLTEIEPLLQTDPNRRHAHLGNRAKLKLLNQIETLLEGCSVVGPNFLLPA